MIAIGHGRGITVDYGKNWEEIAAEVQARFESGIPRIRDLRTRIGAEARVHRMPSITVAPEAWTRDGKGLIHAGAGSWAWGPGGHGVLVGIGPAICADESTVRAILVHEFAHCFKYATLFIDHLELRTPWDPEKVDLNDETRDLEMLVDPRDWFGPNDQTLMTWRDDRGIALSREVEALIAAGALPGTTPLPVGPGIVAVPPDWQAHIRRLRAKRRAH